MKITPYLLLSLLALSILASIWFLLFPSLIPSSLILDKNQRIAVAQLFIDLAGIFSLLLAILEFIRSQRLSNLKVWLVDRSNIQIDLKPVREVRGDRLITENGILGYQFNISLCLENIGNAPAKSVEVHIELDSPPEGLQFQRDEISQQVGKWIGIRPGTQNVRYQYYGGADLICYHHNPDGKTTMDWIKTIGDFTVFIPQTGLAVNQFPYTLILRCIAHSDGSPASIQPLKLTIQSNRRQDE